MADHKKEFICASERQSSLYQKEEEFLFNCKSKEEFIREYENLYKRKPRSKQLYLLILNKLREAVSEDNIDSLLKLSYFIDYIHNLEDELCLKTYYDDANNHIKHTNLIILACKHNKLNILEYLLSSDGKILSNLFVSINGNPILPDNEDEMSHNAFYYAIRSCNCKLLDTLINEWPVNYFAICSEELDKILSQAYEELKLKSVPLSEEMEVFVENKIINLRFFSNASAHEQNSKGDFDKIRGRIELVLQNICLLKAEYTNAEKVDEKFLFIAKFIAQNIHILKRQLKSTYRRLPWEELEFCLVSFISCHVKIQKNNLFYKATLNKTKILYHLENFAKKLREEKDVMESKDISKFTDLPNLKREKVILEIINCCPEFEDLYSDYQQVRDIYSLDKISDYIKLALSADPRQREGQLIITRVLQVIGEYLKNTLESPKLSSNTSELLLLSLPKNTRQIVIDLRNSLSHAYSLSKRTEIEENKDIHFFIGVQNDTKRIDNVITDILYKYKIKMIRELLKKIIYSENLDEIKEVSKILNNFQMDNEITERFNVMEHDKLQKLIEQLSQNITEQTNYEKELFSKMTNVINIINTKSENIRIDYNSNFTILPVFKFLMNDYKIDQIVIAEAKCLAEKILTNIPSQMESCSLKKIAQLSRDIFHSVRLRKPDDKLDEVNRLTCEIFLIAEFGTANLKWIEQLREKLNEKGTFIPMYEHRKDYNITEEKYNNHLSLKLSELKNIFKKNTFSDESLVNLPSYKRNKKLLAVVELLVLDIMSILGRSNKYLENNSHFLDDNTPLLTGKCLRNHLAHDNTLVDVLSDPSIAVILNAKKLISECVVKSHKKIGKLVKDDPFHLKDKYHRSLIAIANQKKLFVALEEGNLEDIKTCLRKGADINGRNISLLSALHFAAHGSSLEIIKLILDENLCANAKDMDGQSPMHIAAAHGRTNIVEFFIRETGIFVDDQDNSGKTSLHIAAKNGHKDTVESLLSHEANTNIKDELGFSPLHYAIQRNHIDVVKVLLGKEANVDDNEIKCGFTSLHLAAENGHLELVKLLLRNKANVNGRNDAGRAPIHSAALTGHVEVVNELILNGADVNSRDTGGCTPLHNATENGHEDVVKILLKNGADANVMDSIYNNTPLHYAAKDGYEKIVVALLKYKANTSITTVEDLTPLHFAAWSGHLKVAAALLDYGANIHAKAKHSTTPLHFATLYGNTEVVKLLIKYGARINDKAYRNQTSLHLAALAGHKEIVELLIKNNGDVSAKDILGCTPLHAAAMNGSKDIVSLLIDNKVEIDARNTKGLTPLHEAARFGHEGATTVLIQNKAEVNAKANYGLTPLFAAIVGGNKDTVNILIKNNAKVNARGIENSTPLHIAVEGGVKEIVQVLIANGANVNAKSNNITPLLSAIKLNHKSIVKVLIENGASVNEEDGKLLALAVIAGYRDIVDILIRNNAFVNVKDSGGLTVLHLAAKRGNKGIVNALITGQADVNAMTNEKTTPLHFAAEEGHRDIVEILIANNANINIKNINGTPLHLAAGNGHANVVEFLLRNGAKINVKDDDNRTPLELAVAYGNLQIVKMLLEYQKVDMNAKGNDEWTILHIASQGNNLEMVKYLVDKGCEIRAKNASGSKPIHIAAREGFKEAVEFFLSKGLSVNELGSDNQTLLHYAAMKGWLEVVKYLIEQGADVNSSDTNGLTPMHIAAYFGYKNIIEALLKNGAIYNKVDKLNRKPLDYSKHNDVTNLLTSTEKLFESVKRNSISEAENSIKAGAFINAKNGNSGMALHHASWKGYEGVVRVLLQNKADPNVVGSKGCTPLHYAAKFSHLKIVNTLLFHGAVYNAVSDSGKTPSDFTSDADITRLFKLISKSFKHVEGGSAEVINDLNKVKDIDTIKAVMGARNLENKTLVVAAVHTNFSKVEQLKEISQGDISTQIDTALVLLSEGNYKKALDVFRSTLKRRKEILGPDNPGTLDIQVYIATVLFKEGAYHESLNLLQEVFEKQKQMLGLNDKDTLNTRSTIALVLHMQGKNEEALNIYQEVYVKQKKMLGPNHSDTLKTQFHLALVLNELKRYEEALSINRAVFEKRKETLGEHNPATVSALNNIALVLSYQKKYEESLQIFKEVYEKKITLGINLADTLRTLGNIAGILAAQHKHHEALKAFQEILDIQKKNLKCDHPDTLTTQYKIGNILFFQGKQASALKVYKDCFDKLKALFGTKHPIVLDILEKMESINLGYKFISTGSSQEAKVYQHQQEDIFIAANNGDVKAVQRFLKDGSDVNIKDIEGRTPLYYAINNRKIDIVNMLLKNGADVSQVTNKGNTPLHTATHKCYNEIVDILLQHVSRDKLYDFVNSKTTCSGSTSLHVAAKSGSFQVVKSLLKHGAAYKIENKDGKIPIDLSKDRKVTNLLKLIEELFKDTKNGNVEAFSKLSSAKSDEFLAITNARNELGRTLLQEAIANGQKDVTSKLLEMLKMPDHSSQATRIEKGVQSLKH